MPRTSVLPQRFGRLFGHMRTAHDHRYAGCAYRVSHAVGLSDHPCHRAEADEPDLLLAYEAHELGFVHGLRISIDKEHFVSRRGERLEQGHPEMRHKVAS